MGLTETEKTLKQILEKYGSNITRRFTEDAIFSANKEWLTQPNMTLEKAIKELE